MANFPEIPGYKIVGQLGKGDLAAVYLGIQEKLDRKVAIKILKPHLLEDTVITARFQREAKAPANLFHSNIVQILDIGTTGDYHYIVMEYLEESLRERMRLKPDGKMEPEIALDIVEMLMKALDYAHLKGVYHRDIKPENIMFRQDGTPVLVDFGIASAFDASDQLTRSGQTIGTVYYMSPEQARAKKKIDGRTDIYSLGALLYEMLTGQKPYDGPSFISVILMHIEDPVPKLPQELSQYQPLIDKMMAKDRANRISNGPEFAQLLEDILENSLDSQSSTEGTFINTPGEPSPSPTIHTQSSQNLKSLIKKYWNLLKEKLVPFLKKRIEKLDLFMERLIIKLNGFIKKTIETLDPVMNKPIIKKLILGVFPGVVILVVILIIIFSQGYQSSTNQSSQSEIALPFFGEIFKQAPKYYEKLTRVHELYQKGDLKSLNDAEGLINELKKTAIIPELEELERKITKRLNLLKRAFKKYFEKALEHFQKNDFPKAMEYILKAKQIKPTDKDILNLKKLIEKSIGKQKPKKILKGFYQ